MQQVDHQCFHSIIHNSHISPETTGIRFRTPIQKLRRHRPHSCRPARLPGPTSSLDLLDNLNRWRRCPPKPEIAPFRHTSPSSPANKTPTLNFEKLHAYHARFPAFQTHLSFRVLGEIAINEEKFEAVRGLWIEVNRKGMLSDWDSLNDGGVSLWAVWVRWMVRQGKWAEAWKTAQRWRAKIDKLSASELASEGLPHAIWIELLGKAHRSIDRPPSSGSSSRRRGCLTHDKPPNAPGVVEGGGLGLEEQHMLLMRQPPHRNRSQITNDLRSRSCSTAVRGSRMVGECYPLLV